MSMPRERAEAEGWKSCRRQGSSIVEWWRFLLTDESPSVMEHRIYGPEKHCLAAITAIERYRDTADLLAAAKVLLVGVRNELAEMDVDGGYEHYHAIGSFLAKLEAHHAGT